MNDVIQKPWKTARSKPVQRQDTMANSKAVKAQRARTRRINSQSIINAYNKLKKQRQSY